MKKIVFTFFVLAVFTGMWAEAAAATPKMVEMDIYPRGAKVTFEINAAPTVNFQLPGSFELDSIRVVPSQSANVLYMQKRYIDNPAETPDVLVDVQKKINAVNAELLEINGKLNAFNKSTEMITNLAHVNNLSNMSKSTTTSDIQTFSKWLVETYTNLNVEYYKLITRKDVLTKELHSLNNKYNSMLPVNFSRLADITLASSGSGKIYIEAYTSYAGWQLSYKMDLNSADKTIKSILVATAFQKSGIVYNGPINFYTQAPAYVNIPVLNAQAVAFQPDYSKYNTSSKKSVRASAETSMEGSYVTFSADYYDSDPIPAVAESLTNFSVKGTGRVEGDGTPVMIELGATNFTCDLKMILIGDYSSAAYLKAVIKEVKEPFLPGNILLSVDGANSGTTTIGSFGRGEDVEIPFGFMPLVKVYKTVNISKSSDGGVFTSGSVEDGYALEVVNGSKLEADIVLIDRIPFPVNDKITLENISVTPVADKNVNNVLTWNLILKPGESKKFTVKYKLKYPSDSQIYIYDQQ